MNLLLDVKIFCFIQFYAGAVLKQTSLIGLISTIGALQIVLVLCYRKYQPDIVEISRDSLGDCFFDNLVDVE